MVFNKKKDDIEPATTETETETRDDGMTEAPSIDPVQAPQALMASTEAIQQEWEIFETRLKTLFDSIKRGAPKSATKKAFSHAKHASMCVRDALKEFGRTKL